MSKYASNNVEWHPATGLPQGPALIPVDPERETRVIPATAYENLLNLTEEVVTLLAYQSDDHCSSLTASERRRVQELISEFSGERDSKPEYEIPKEAIAAAAKVYYEMEGDTALADWSDIDQRRYLAKAKAILRPAVKISRAQDQERFSAEAKQTDERINELADSLAEIQAECEILVEADLSSTRAHERERLLLLLDEEKLNADHPDAIPYNRALRNFQRKIKKMPC